MTASLHLGFILAAYGLTAIVLGATIVTLVLDQRRQKRLLARFDGQARRNDRS